MSKDEEKDFLLHEYDKIVDLFISEGRAAWESVNIYMVLQGVLISTVVVFSTQCCIESKTIGYLVLFLAGATSSFVWFFMQYRSVMWRENWILAGLKVERELKERIKIEDDPFKFAIFEIEIRARKRKEALELFEDKAAYCQKNAIRYRNQMWCERIGSLRPLHWSMLIMGILWSIAFVLLCISQYICFLVKVMMP